MLTQPSDDCYDEKALLRVTSKENTSHIQTMLSLWVQRIIESIKQFSQKTITINHPRRVYIDRSHSVDQSIKKTQLVYQDIS